jgi:hypothetical protein
MIKCLANRNGFFNVLVPGRIEMYSGVKNRRKKDEDHGKHRRLVLLGTKRRQQEQDTAQQQEWTTFLWLQCIHGLPVSGHTEQYLASEN